MTDQNPKSNRKPDFSGFATAYEVLCTDGRIIGSGSFDHQDGVRVPLVWRHQHNEIDNVLGHGILYKHPKGMRIDGYFNHTKSGRQAKALVNGHDIEFLSVWANQVKQAAERVVHGMIREVSLVLAGANPRASIDTVFVHSDSYNDADEDFKEGVIIHTGMKIEFIEEEEEVVEVVEVVEEVEEPLQHEGGPTLQSILESMNEEQKGLVGALIQSALTNGELDTSEPSDGQSTVGDIYDSLTAEQKDVLHYMVGFALDDQAEIQQSDEEGTTMQHNIFEDKNKVEDGPVISHDQMNTLIADVFAEALRTKATSLKAVFLAHAGTYGIDNLSVLFPEAVNVNGPEPTLYGREQEWVPLVMNRIRKVPFSKIKSAYADINAAEARAKGYITAAQKFEEVFPLFSRETTPQTVYKKQKLDRDDILDITSFDIVTWLKKEMRIMLLEELARAVLISDGRGVADPDKIIETRVRPIYTDADLYAHHILFATADDILDIIDGITAAREHYRGSGSPSLYLAPGVLASMLLVRDTTNRRIYPTENDLKLAMRVSEIVEVPLMTGVQRDGAVNVQDLIAILVNLSDYTIGADRGGETSFFDQFDIDFNQYKYLYETRVSGALTKPKSAIVFEQDTGVLI